MARIDEARAELTVLELEDKLVKAKAGNTSTAKLRELKDEVRSARQSYRELRESGEGDASPAPIRASARTNSAGGK